MKNQITYTNKILLATLALLLSVSVASAAWNAPTATPPGNNPLPPINVGSETQTKDGNLVIQGINDTGAPYATGLGVLNGNVGFGTVDPKNKLQLFNSGAVTTYAQFGNVTTGSGATDGTIYGVDPNGHGYFWNYEAKDLYFGTTNLARLVVSALGNIGIGTVSPAHKVSVEGGDVSFATDKRGVRWSGIAGWDWLINTDDTGAGNVPLYIKSNSAGTGLTTKVTVSSAGNVGIGTVTPTAKLDILEGGLWVHSRDLDGGPQENISLGEFTDVRTIPLYTISTSDKDDQYILKSNRWGSLQSWKRGSPTGDHTVANLSSATGAETLFTLNHADTDINTVRLSTGGNSYLNGGNVGIGTITPGAKLEVAGQVKITGGTPGVGKVLTSDASGLASWQTPASAPVSSCTPTLSVGATYTSSGTYTVPSNVTSIQVEVWGAGGGGGTSSTSDGSGNGILEGGVGGGSGSYSRSTITIVPGQTYAVTVGAGGSAPPERFTAAGNGGNSSFSGTGGTISANGGKGGFGFGNGYPTPATIGGLSVVLPSRDTRLDQVGEYVLGGAGGLVGSGDVTTPGNPGGTLQMGGSATLGGTAVSGTTGGSYGKGGDGNAANAVVAASQGGVGAVVVSVLGGCAGTTAPSAGVSQILAGPGLTVTPTIGTGIVTVGNTIPSVHTGSESQTKEGNLLIQGLDATGAARSLGFAVLNGSVGIGTLTPTAKLDINTGIGGAAGVRVGAPSMGSVSLAAGTLGTDNNYPGYIQWLNGLGTRLSYLGYDSASNMSWRLENGANLQINGGNVELAGQIKIAGGVPGAGKVLTSDASGLASWQTPAAAPTCTAGSSGTEVFDANRTWTVPEGVTSVKIKMWGAGGKGGSGGTTGTQGYTGPGGGGGGGAGAYAEKTVTVVAGNTFTVSIPANNLANTTVIKSGSPALDLSVGSGSNGGVGSNYTSGGEKAGSAAGGAGGLGGTISAGMQSFFDTYNIGKTGDAGAAGYYSSGYGYDNVGGNGGDGYVTVKGGIGGAQGGGAGNNASGYSAGGGGAAGYNSVVGLGGKGRVVIEYSGSGTCTGGNTTPTPTDGGIIKNCTNASTDPICVAAKSNGGRGDTVNRAISCIGTGAGTFANRPVATSLFYEGGIWKFYGIDGGNIACVDGSLMVASTGGTSTGTIGSGMLGEVPDAILCQSSTDTSKVIMYAQGVNTVSWGTPGRMIYSSDSDAGPHLTVYFNPTTGAWIDDVVGLSQSYTAAINGCRNKSLSQQTGFKFAGINNVSGTSGTCPSGTTKITTTAGNTSCVENTRRSSVDVNTDYEVCTLAGMRICTTGELKTACTQSPSIFPADGSFEKTSDVTPMTNIQGIAVSKSTGGTCSTLLRGDANFRPLPYRCCLR